MTSCEILRIKVPGPFAAHLRLCRLFRLVAFISACALMSWLLQRPALLAASGVPGAALFFFAVSSRAPLYYAVRAEGIGLQTRGGWGGMSGVASGLWINLIQNPVVEVEVSHWRQLPAVLIKTRRNPHGYVVALEREDITRVQNFLLASVS